MTEIVVISNMYPSVKHPSYGVFIKNFNNQLSEISEINEIYLFFKVGFFNKLFAYLQLHISTFVCLLQRQPKIVLLHHVTHLYFVLLIIKCIDRIKNRKTYVFAYGHGSDIFLDHVDRPLQSKILRYLRNRTLLRVDKLIVGSEQVKQFVQSQLKCVPNISVLGPGSINEVFFATARGDLQRYDICIAARLAHGKSQDKFFQLLKRFNVTNLNVACVGSGPNEYIVRQSAKGINVTFFDALPQEDLTKIFQQSKFLVNTSELNEGFGLVVLEAAASGCIPLLLKTCGVVTELSDQKNAFVFKRLEDIVLFLAHSRNLLSTDDLRSISDGAMENAIRYNQKFKSELKNIFHAYT